MRYGALATLACAGSVRSFSIHVLPAAPLVQHPAAWRHRTSRKPHCRTFSNGTICMGRQREGDVADSNDKKKKKPTKSNLPSKVCATCGRPFTWRKKWEGVWEEVKYCSDRCRNSRSKGTPDSAAATAAADAVTRSFSSSATRRQWTQVAAAAITSAVLTFQPRAAAAKPAPPTAAEVEAVLSSVEWDDDDTPFTADDFKRLDSSPDSAFYDSPKLVEHIDAPAQAAMLRFYTTFLADVAQTRYGSGKQQQPDVLDLCASWVSHLPSSYSADTAGPRVAGLGMNAAELKLNK
jgi:hypothetical protein